MRGFITDPTAQSGLRRVDDLPEPQPGRGEFLLDVRAYSINPGEVILIRRRPDRWRPGQDVAGYVIRAAEDGSGPPAGARVAARLDWEGWAERAAVPVHLAAVLPDSVTFEQAATIPIAGLTALRALRLGGSILGGDVLVTGATGGVGQFAIQLAIASGAHVTALVSSVGRTQLARDLGASTVVTDLQEEPHLGPFQLILDGIGGATLTQSVRLLTSEGLAVVYGGTGGPASLHISDFAPAAHNARVVGFISEAPVHTKGHDIGVIARLIAEGRVRPLIGLVCDWADTPQIFTDLADRKFRGKAVLVREPG
jgi:NADPH:quinone reductase-like Zn-dependent oxidoreductase